MKHVNTCPFASDSRHNVETCADCRRAGVKRPIDLTPVSGIVRREDVAGSSEVRFVVDKPGLLQSERQGLDRIWH